MKSVGKRKWLAAAAAMALTGCTTATESATEPTEPTSSARLAETSTPRPRIVTFPEGTVLKGRTTTSISTNTHQTGDTFVGTLHEPLIEGTRVVAAKGARVEGLVADANKGGRVKGVAEVSVRLTKPNFANGQVVEIATGSVGRRARTTKKSDATKIGIASRAAASASASPPTSNQAEPEEGQVLSPPEQRSAPPETVVRALPQRRIKNRKAGQQVAAKPSELGPPARPPVVGPASARAPTRTRPAPTNSRAKEPAVTEPPIVLPSPERRRS